jgi:hypothetical protein
MARPSRTMLAAKNAAQAAAKGSSKGAGGASPGKENSPKKARDVPGGKQTRAPKKKRDTPRERPRSSWHAALLPRRTEGEPELSEATRRALNERHGVARFRWCHYNDDRGAYHLLLLHNPELLSAQQWAAAAEATGLLPDRLQLTRVSKTPLWQTYAKHLADVPGAEGCTRQLHENIIELGVPPPRPAEAEAEAEAEALPAAQPAAPAAAYDDPVDGAAFLLLDAEPAPPPPPAPLPASDPLAKSRAAVMDFLRLPGLWNDAAPDRVLQLLSRAMSPLQLSPEDREYLGLARADRNRRGLAEHMPGPQTRDPTRLELHRRALALWRLVETCLLRVAAAPPEAFRGLDGEAREDLAVATLCYNEARLAGAPITIEPLGGEVYARATDELLKYRQGQSDPSLARGRLVYVLADLLNVRTHAAFTRLPHVDFVNWALPFMGAVARLVHSGELRGSAAAAEARRLNALLGDALREDAAPLYRYGARLTALARRMLSIVTGMRLELPPGTGLVPVDAYGNPQRNAPQALCLPFPSAFAPYDTAFPALTRWHDQVRPPLRRIGPAARTDRARPRRPWSSSGSWPITSTPPCPTGPGRRPSPSASSTPSRATGTPPRSLSTSTLPPASPPPCTTPTRSAGRRGAWPCTAPGPRPVNKDPPLAGAPGDPCCRSRTSRSWSPPPSPTPRGWPRPPRAGPRAPPWTRAPACRTRWPRSRCPTPCSC